MYQGIFPTGEPPATAEGLAAVLGPSTTTVADYTRAQTVRGAESAFMLMMGHGVEADYDQIASSFPTGPGGKKIPTGPFRTRAAPLAQKMVAMMAARSAVRASRVTRAPSESTS